MKQRISVFLLFFSAIFLQKEALADGVSPTEAKQLRDEVCLQVFFVSQKKRLDLVRFLIRNFSSESIRVRKDQWVFLWEFKRESSLKLIAREVTCHCSLIHSVVGSGHHHMNCQNSPTMHKKLQICKLG